MDCGSKRQFTEYVSAEFTILAGLGSQTIVFARAAGWHEICMFTVTSSAYKMVNDKRAGQVMAEGPKTGLRNVILIWVIGLTLGIAAGAATAMLLMPGSKGQNLVDQSIADRIRGR